MFNDQSTDMTELILKIKTAMSKKQAEAYLSQYRAKVFPEMTKKEYVINKYSEKRKELYIYISIGKEVIERNIEPGNNRVRLPLSAPHTGDRIELGSPWDVAREIRQHVWILYIQTLISICRSKTNDGRICIINILSFL